ncbi:MAG: tRNA modification GTPase [Spirochaetaceae bacterium]|jgi:tRNA modification GTPase|nr:tRNA modification GTPase [Spirochaetaceae bacterium]
MQNPAYTDLAPIAAIATARGPAALSVIRTSGQGSIELLARVFSRPKALREVAGNTVVYGWIIKRGEASPLVTDLPLRVNSSTTPHSGGVPPQRPPFVQAGTPHLSAALSGHEKSPSGHTGPSREPVSRIDEVLVNVYCAPRSYTGEDGADIICHGGSAAPNAVLDILLRSGFREALRGEFTFRAFANGKLGLARAESVLEMVDARTDKARENAVSRLSGVLETEIDAIKQNLVTALAALELSLDYSELDGIEDAPDGLPCLPLVNDALARLESLEEAYRSQRLYSEGALVVIAGIPNAGKSSLFNLLLKEERAIVTPVPGTTRDYIEATLDIGGIPVRLVDTAGLREDADGIEAEGIRRSRALMDEADLVILVKDSSEPESGPMGTASHTESSSFTPGAAPHTEGSPSHRGQPSAPGTVSCAEVNSLRQGQPFHTEAVTTRARPTVTVWNKIDLGGGRFPADSGLGVPLSAKTGAGLPELLQAVSEALLGEQPPEHGPALGTDRQRALVDRAITAIKEAVVLADSSSGEPPALDLAAPALKTAVDALGEITGEVTNDAILTTMFTKFCVGK